jgi:3-oxoacyl-[acyl-carrier protein] reductase
VLDTKCNGAPARGVAIVTGGSRGIGRAIVKTLAEFGYQVHTCARNSAALAMTVNQVPGVKGTALDVTDAGATHAWLAHVIEAAKRIDVLVNNVGVMSAVGPLAQIELEEWMSVFDRNLFSMVRVCQQVIPVMIRQHGGCIINLAGGGSAYPRKHFTAYACSKAAVVRLSDSLAEELKEHGIRVNAVGPGLQESHIWRHAIKAGERPTNQDWDSPEELARLIRFIVTTPYVTGKFLHIKDRYEQAGQDVMTSDLWTLRRINSPAAKPS